MSQTPDLDTVLQLGKIAENLLNGKEFFVGTVADRLHHAAMRYPHDQTVKTLEAVIQKRFEKEGSLATISQREFQDLYNQTSGLGNPDNFREVLGDLLLEGKIDKVAHYNDDYIQTIRSDGSGEEYEYVDQTKVAELSELFGFPADEKSKSTSVENGRQGIYFDLVSMGFDNPAVEVAVKDSNFVVFAAEVQTKIGRVPFIVPAEVKLGSVLLPSVFVSGNEFVKFTKANILTHAKNLKSIKTATPQSVLHTLNKIYGKAKPQKLSDKQASQEHKDVHPSSLLGGDGLLINQNNGLYSELIEEQVPHGAGFDFRKAELPEPLEELTADGIRETLVESGLSFDRETVLKAKAAVANELRSIGIHHDKLTIASEFSNGFTLATTITGADSKKTIEVPVEVKNGQPLMPSTFTSGLTVKAFDAKSLTAFANEQSENHFDTFFSDKYSMSFQELHKLALKSAAYGNFLEVEESMAIIEDKFGAQLHRLAFDDLMTLTRVGFSNESDSPLSDIDVYVKKAKQEIADKEAQVKVSNSLLYLYPEDDRKE